jgi:hypothetical protein
VDETYIKIKKVWMYLYRAVDSEGNTLEFLLSPTRDAEAAKRFFGKALQLSAGSASGASGGEKPAAEPFGAGTLKASRPAPRVINVESSKTIGSSNV